MADNTTKFFKGISTQTIITLTMGVMEIVVFAIISRLLSKEDFGYYAAISGIIAIFLSISEAGLGSSIIQKKDASNTFVSTAFTWSLIIGSVISIIVFILAPYLANIIADSKLTIPLRAMSITILLNSIISVGNGILYRKLSFKTVGLISIISYFTASTVSIIMASMGLGLYAVIALPITNAITHSCFLFYFVNYPKLQIHRNETKEIVSFGGWLTLGVIFNNITHQLDKLLLPKWMSVETLGAYNRPAGFVSSISMRINGIFDTVLFPMLSDFQNDRSKVKEVFRMSVSLLNSFSIILAAVFFFNAHLIIAIFFGEDWLDLIPVMQIISISIIFNINGRLVDCFFRSLAYVKLGFYLRVLAAAITFGCIYVGASYDVQGVAMAIVTANIANILIKLGFLSKKTEVSIWDIIYRMFVAWRPVIPILLIGIPFLIYGNGSIVNDIGFAILFSAIICIELIFFPKFVGEIYYVRVYPIIKGIINKIL